MPKVVPAHELAAKASKPYPNDSDDYRKARKALIEDEIELRRQIQRVAAKRRALPLGGEARDYRFLNEDGKEVGLADLFGSASGTGADPVEEHPRHDPGRARHRLVPESNTPRSAEAA